MSDNDGSLPRTPESTRVARKRTRLSAVWLIPILAAAAGGWVAVTRVLAEGPEVTIEFATAEGLAAGKTKISYNGVEVGTLTDIDLSDDHLKVVATARMKSSAESLLVEDTNFWVVRPRISGSSISGLGTLLSGAYLSMEIGASKKPRRHFKALEEPPVVVESTQGRFFELKTSTLGSLSHGTPIYFRRLKVGEVASYELAKDGQSFAVKAFVDAPYDQYVNPATRFWHASGVDLSLSANGISMQTESLVSILVGGLAFETPANGASLPPADENATFELFADRHHAMMPAALDPHTYRVAFDQEVRGLEVGAPVDFRGIQIGEVLDIVGDLDTSTFEFSVLVKVSLDPERLGVNLIRTRPTDNREVAHKEMVDALVEHGVRAQLRTGSLLTGALYVALDYFPDAVPAKIDWAQKPVRIPSVPGSIAQLESEIAGIVKKIDALPLKQIGKDLQKAIVDLDATLVSARGTFDGASAMIAPNSVLLQQLEGTLQEVSGAARSLRVLTDFLERQPESLIKGKSGGGK
jgi:paraquat-inducible protein B